MNYLPFIIIGSVLFTLFKDYGKDKGQFTKAKIFHFLFVVAICLNYSGTFRYLGWTLLNFNKVKELFDVPIGVVPGTLHLLFYFLHVGLMVIFLLLVYSMSQRNNKARVRIFYVLPFLALSETFNFYTGWILDGNDSQMGDAYIFLIGFLLFGGITGAIMAVYNSNFMREFFYAPALPVSSNGDILDSDELMKNDDPIHREHEN